MNLFFMYGVLLFVPLLASVLVRKKFKNLVGYLLAVFLSTFLMASTVAVHWFANDLFLTKKVAPLDRNGDGFWSQEEQATWSQEERKYFKIRIGDGGRNLFVGFIFPIFSLTYSLLTIGAIWFVVTRRERKFPSKLLQ